MADKITFPETLNTSVQVGDELWYSNITTPSNPSDPVLLGDIESKGENWVKVDSQPGVGGQAHPDLIINGDLTTSWDTSIITNGDFTTDASGWGGNIGAIYDSTDLDVDGNVDNPIVHNANGWMDFGDLTNGVPAAQYKKLNWSFGSAITTGKTYRVSFEVKNYQAGTLQGKFTDNIASFLFIHNYVTVSGDGVYTFDATMPDVGSSGYLSPVSQWQNRFWLESDGTFIGSVDNISVQELLPPTSWTFDTNWSFNTSGTAVHTPGTADYLIGTLNASMVPGETYELTMDIISGSSGEIKLVNTSASTPVDVPVVIDSSVGTATWIQSAVHPNEIYIYQTSAGDYEIDNVTLNQTSFDLADALGGTTPNNLFFMFRKPIHSHADLPNGGYTNTSSLKGYHAEVEFTNNSASKQELFVVGSEVTISSK